MTQTYTLYIKAYTPTTIPMARLARYMQNLAEMLGHEADVHFDALKEGSTQLVSKISHEAVPKVEEHLALVKQGKGTPAAIKAKMEIDDLLSGDNATGFIYQGNNETDKVIVFPGVTRPKPTSYGPFKQEGSLDGVLISVGGADETAHIQLQNGNIKYTGIHTDRETARRLAKHMYDPVRVFGTGRWLRDKDGNWILISFKVRQDFMVLKSDSLKHVIEQMRGIEGSEWKSMDDPIGALRALRDKGNGLH